jgi:hypothetical protein
MHKEINVKCGQIASHQELNVIKNEIKFSASNANPETGVLEGQFGLSDVHRKAHVKVDRGRPIKRP